MIAKKDNTGTQILVAMVLGLIIGLVLFYNNWTHVPTYLSPISDVFLKLLKMVMAPLVLASIFMSVVNLGTPLALRDLGKKTVIYYFLTTAIAVTIGIIVVNLIRPGDGMNLAFGDVSLAGAPDKLTSHLEKNQGLFTTILGVFINSIPSSPFGALSDVKVLQIIVFSIIMGVVALHQKEKSQTIIKLVDELQHLVITLVFWIMKLAPYGIFVLMLEFVARTGPDALKALWKYALTVLIGLFLHSIFLLLMGSWRQKISPVAFLKALMSPLMLAFSSASSAATLPISMAAVRENLGVKEKVTNFVLPLGATINMDGTALYESVAVIFVAQSYGIQLAISQQILIFVTATLAAVGAAAIPGAGLITMSMVLTTVGLPLEGIGIILAIDRLLDMFRTAVNVLGDCVGASVVASLDKDN